MRARIWLVAALAVVGLGLAVFVFADEKVEQVVAPETGALRPPEGEWIPSVRGMTAEIWAVGDADPPASAGVARLIRRANPDRILYVGDVYPDGHADDFMRWAKPWRRLVRRMAPTPGNHDWPEAREGYEPYWRKVRGETPPSYYSFKAGGWEILSVNSEHAEWRPAENWLEEEVKPGGNCRIAFWHEPRFSAGKHRDPPHRVEEFWEVLEGRARVIVNGHDHNWQRMRPRDGIIELIAGAGGRHLYEVDEGDGRLAFSNDTDYAALRLGLKPGRAAWRFVAVDGAVLDKGSLRCRTS